MVPSIFPAAEDRVYVRRAQRLSQIRTPSKTQPLRLLFIIDAEDR